MKILKLYICILCMLCGTAVIHADNKLPGYPTMKIEGVVTDAATGKPLDGIMIEAVGYPVYTAMTKENGSFTIEMPTFATQIRVHAPLYLSQLVSVGQGNLSIALLPDKFQPMYEMTDITASRSARMQNTTSQTVETDIEGTLGADVRAISRNGGPGYGTAMFIRGLNSLTANAQPLIVIDGVLQDLQQTRTALHDGDYNNLLLNVNPEDVERVTVLKNATALYGAKGGNGVIIIETKRGRSQATRIDANIGAGVTMVPRLPEMMNASQYRLYASEMLGTYPNYNGSGLELKFLNDDASKFYYPTYHNDTVWSKEVYHTALTQNYNINVQGGDNVGMYNLSLGYTDAKSTARDNGFDRLNVRFNTDIKVVDKLTTRFDLSYAKVNRNVFDNGAPTDFSAAPVSSPTLLGLVKAPILHPYAYNNVSRELSPALSDADDFLTDLNADLTLGNPTALLKNGNGINKNRTEMTHFNAVVAPRYEFSKSLSLTETFSYALDRISQRYYRPTGGMPTLLIEGVGRVQNMAISMFSKQTSIVSDTRLEWERMMGAHSIKAFGGMRFTSFAFDDNEPKGQYATAANDKTPNISKDMDFIEAKGADDEWRSMTWYAQADYNYRHRYFLQASIAMETNSRFGKEADGGVKLGGVQWALFPSVQAGWLISNEQWFPKAKTINYLLIRAGYDLSGNDDISNYAARTSFGVSKYLWKSTAAQLDNISNEHITWEKTRKLNLGLKAWLLNNRLGVDFDIFHHQTDDLLTLKQMETPVAGVTSYWSNGGSLSNTGFELTLTAKPVVSRSLNIEVGASMGHYKNKVKSLPSGDYTNSIYGKDNILTAVGQPVGVFYGYKTVGVLSTDTEASMAGNDGYLYQVDATGSRQYFQAGDMHFMDLNGDGEISEKDKTVIGDPNPDLYGNIFANIQWKDFTLYLGLNYSLGNDVFNYQRSILEGGSNFYNQTTSMTNRWRAEGQQTSMPSAIYGDPMGNSRFSDRWIEDDSYLRLKTVRLSYRIPVNFDWLQGLSVWAEANNLLTLTRYLGSDPEFSAANGVLYQGIDTGNVAQGRSFTFGMKINL